MISTHVRFPRHVVRFQSFTAALSVTVPTHHLNAESAFSLFKRGLNGAFHKVSSKHLQRYLDEFGYRFNNRKAPDLFGMTIARMAKIGGMPNSKLVEENAFTQFVKP